MSCRKAARSPWALFAIALLVVWGCGRNRENPIDPNFPGSESLNPPTNVRAQGDIGRIVLSWNPIASNNLAGYGVWRATSSTGNYARIRGGLSDSLITTGRTTFVDTTLNISVAKVYFYKVNTVDVLGQSSNLSVFASAEVLEDKRPPGQPSDLSVVTDETTGTVSLSWNPPLLDAGNQELTGLNGYKVFRAKDTEDSFVQIGTLPAAQTTFVDSSDLELNARYFYRVSALDGVANEGARSATASITTTGTGVAVPGNLRTLGKIGEVEVQWNAVSEPNLLGYLLLRSTSTQSAFQPVTSDTLFTTAQTVYVDADVVAGTIYFYRVQAVIQDSERGLVRSESSPFTDGEAINDESAPAAPSDLIVSIDQKNIGTIQLSWTAPTTDSNGGELTGLFAFRVFRSRETSSSFALLTELPATRTSYQDTSVERLTRYFYAVSAVDSSQNVGSRSAAVSVTTLGLAQPRNVQATAGPHEIVIDWTANTEQELTGYEVLRFTDPTQANPDKMVSTVRTTFVDSPLVAGISYIYRVRAVGSGGISSELSGFVSSSAVGFSAPSNLRSVAGPRDITWTQNSEQAVTGYDVLRFSDPSNPVPERTFRTLQTTYVDSPLTSEVTYTYRVRAVGAGGIPGQLSIFVSDSPLGFAAPRSLLASPGPQEILLTWAPSTEQAVTGYRVLRFNDPSDAEPSETFNTVQTVYLDSPLVAGQTYVYRVRAVGSSGIPGQLSNFVSAIPAAKLAAPRNVAVTADVKLATITWSANTETELTGYRVLRYNDAAETGATATFTTLLTTYVDSPLVAGQTYVYRIQALGNGGLVSKLSTFASATIPEDNNAPAAPGVLSAVLSGDTNIQLTWSAPKSDLDGTTLTGLSGYRVYRSQGTGSAGFQVVGNVDSAVVTYLDAGLAQSTTFIYRVSALDASGNESSFSSSVSLTTGSSSGISSPTNVAALALEDPDLGLVVRVTWSAPGGIVEFRVQRQTVGSTSSASFETIVASQNATVFNDTNVERGKTYIYQILSKSGSALSVASDPVVVAVPSQ